ncbi:TIGR04211 family SH3 domain-containing protein [Shewanella morhuae]|uniref:TIGR04211 family SH3 domain-containing protein n=1 Tax=Shewanella morhuae TaxID=365591 RepID=UPI0009712002|nr:TIGR04211 family SH3 domain-containing protein [Shewanella morhuae]
MLLSSNLLAEGQSRFISDNVFLYLLGGPGTEFRIVGSIEAGQPVTLLNETQGDYSKIIDHKNREGWVQTNLISSTQSFREQVPALTAELAQTKAKLTEVLGSTNNHADEVAELKTKLSELESNLATTTQERDKLKNALDSSAQDERFELWRQGGLIAGMGLLVGIILVYLPRPQRRSKKRWM